jgi:hypothetical protein
VPRHPAIGKITYPHQRKLTTKCGPCGSPSPRAGRGSATGAGLLVWVAGHRGQETAMPVAPRPMGTVAWILPVAAAITNSFAAFAPVR